MLYTILIGFLAGLLNLLPGLWRRALITGFCSLAVVGMLQDLIAPIIGTWGPLSVLSDWLFSGNGLSIGGAAGLFCVVAAATGTSLSPT